MSALIIKSCVFNQPAITETENMNCTKYSTYMRTKMYKHDNHMSVLLTS